MSQQATTATIATPSTAVPTISAERRHFNEHGWILLRGVLDAAQVERYRRCIDRAGDGLYAVERGGGKLRCDQLILRDPAFVEYITTPGILQTYSDIAGCAAVLKNCWSYVNAPWPNRHDAQAVAKWRAAEAERGWHRGSEPKWAMYADERHPGMHHFPYLNFFTYLTDVGPDRGITPVLDGSHRVGGDYHAVRKRCEPIELTANAGDILVFSESLMHTGAVIMNEVTRYAMAYTFIPPFYSNDQDFEVPRWFYDTIANDDLRGVLGAWRGVISPHRFGLMEPYAYDFASRIEPGKAKSFSNSKRAR
jgi:hypothetical protein